MENLFKARINFKYVLFLIKKNTRFMVLATTFMFALYPLLVFTQYVLDNSTTYNEYSFMIGRVFLTLLLTLSVFIVPLNLFSYLNAKRNLDVYHALPIKRKDLFLSTLLSSIVIILIPYTLIYGVGAIYNVLVVADVDTMLLFKQYFYSIALAIAILMPILFAMMNTGTAIDGFIYSGLIHLLPALTYGTYILFGETKLLGFSPNPDQLFLIFSTPIYTLFDLNFNITRTYPNVWLIVGYWLLFSFVATWIVLYLYKIRKSEKAENPFTNRWFFPIFTTALIMVVQIFFYSAFSNFSNNDVIIDVRTLIFPVVFTFVGYMVLDIIANRGFRHFLRGILNFIAITAVTLSVFYGLVVTDGFGYVTKVPSASRVNEVTIIVSDSSGVYSPSDYYEYDSFRNTDRSMVFKEEAQIEIIALVHQNILDEYEKSGYDQNAIYVGGTDPYYRMDYGSISFEYEMNNGSTISRNYSVRSSWLEGLEQLFSTTQYFTFTNNVLELIINDSPTINMRRFVVGDVLESNVETISGDLAKEFAEAYKQDYLSKNWESHARVSQILGFIQLEVCTIGTSPTCTTPRYPINQNDLNTLAFLQQNDRSIETVENLEKTYVVAIPRATANEFFQLPRIYDYLPDIEISIVEINHQEAIQLIPFLMYGKKVSENHHLLFVSNNVLSPDNSNKIQIYFINNDGMDVLSQIIEDKNIERVSLIDIHEKLPVR